MCGLNKELLLSFSWFAAHSEADASKLIPRPDATSINPTSIKYQISRQLRRGARLGIVPLCHFRSTRMKKALLFPIFKSFDPAKRASWGRCMHLFLSALCSPSWSCFYRCARTSILNAANCLLRRRDVSLHRPFFGVEKKDRRRKRN